jgi:hypothetical protein
MRILFLALLLSLTCTSAFALEALQDFLSQTPAQLQGRLRFESTIPLGSGEVSMGAIRIPTGLRIVSTRSIRADMGFTLDETKLKIFGGDALQATAQLSGVTLHFKIKTITYNSATGRFSAQVDTPIGIGAKEISKQIVEQLETRFKSKMAQAFIELKKIREQSNFDDTKKAMDTIVKLLTESSAPRIGAPIPNHSGEVNFTFDANRASTLCLGDLDANVVAGDHIIASLDYRYRAGQLSVGRLQLNSIQGIILRRANENLPEFRSVRLQQMSLDNTGAQFDYSIGAEEVIAGAAIALNASRGQGPRPACPGCEAGFAATRVEIDDEFKASLSALVRQNDGTFMGLKLQPQQLASLRPSKPPKPSDKPRRVCPAPARR